MLDNNNKTKRIAKNTFVLYIRMLFLMGINLYTSRVILRVLGVEDFGIYNVVGGFVALFAVLSQSLSSATSRYLNFEMGTGNKEKLTRIFSTTVVIHFFLIVLILFLSEVVGIWFVNNKMVIPENRLFASNWVYQISLLSFCFNLITVPHHAAIIAHEDMNIFAYVSIFEGVAKLLICYLVNLTAIDHLIFYALLLLIVQIVSRGIYWYYSRNHYAECKFSFVYDKALLKEIFGFASWNVIGSSSVILRNQGGNILLNLFFGPVVNAARAIANQVLHAVTGFVDNFYMALRPQITQSYANGDKDYMMKLIFQGSRLSYYMIFLICFPIILKADYILHLWLNEVPDTTLIFVQLTLVFAMIESFSPTLITAQLASGKVRNYQIIVGGLQLLNIPVSYALFKMGASPDKLLYVAIFFSICCLFARLIMLKINIGFDIYRYISRVILNAVLVSLTSAIVPCLLVRFMNDSIGGLLLITFVCVICTTLSILYIGSSAIERRFVINKVVQKCNFLKK